MVKDLCLCGHSEDKHAERAGYCLEYPYGNFDNKCTCQCYSPYLTLSSDADILDLTDPEDPPQTESDETI